MKTLENPVKSIIEDDFVSLMIKNIIPRCEAPLHNDPFEEALDLYFEISPHLKGAFDDFDSPLRLREGLGEILEILNDCFAKPTVPVRLRKWNREHLVQAGLFVAYNVCQKERLALLSWAHKLVKELNKIWAHIFAKERNQIIDGGLSLDLIKPDFMAFLERLDDLKPLFQGVCNEFWYQFARACSDEYAGDMK